MRRGPRSRVPSARRCTGSSPTASPRWSVATLPCNAWRPTGSSGCPSPPARRSAPTRPPRRTAAGEPQAPITRTRGDLQDLRLVPVTTRAESGLWNELVDRDHDLGRTQSAGAQCRYLAYAGDRVLAALGFGAAAWHLAARDRYIGWTDAERQAHLHEVVQNRRLMVLPWVSVRGLASALLGLAARRLPADWVERAGSCWKASPSVSASAARPMRPRTGSTSARPGAAGATTATGGAGRRSATAGCCPSTTASAPCAPTGACAHCSAAGGRSR